MQMQLGNRVAQNVVVPFDQLFVEMLDREATVDVALQAQHSLDFSHRRTAQRRRQPPVGQTRQTTLPMAIAPATEGSFADPKQFRRLDLAQLRPFRPAQNIFETHPPYPLVNACPVHQKPPLQEVLMTGHFTSYKTRPNHELATQNR